MSEEETKKEKHDDGGEGHSAMAERGVTRPQMHHESGHADGGMEMSHQDRVQMRQKHHEQTLWVPLVLVMLGVWLLSAPFTFGYASYDSIAPDVARMTAGRGWFPLSMRNSLMMWSDLLSGLALIVLGAIWTRTPKYPVVPWLACFVGVWLNFAPVVFWSPSAAAYLNDTFIGAWVIALTILIPGMPPMIMIMKMGAQTPPGWSYNPSSWLQRAPLAATGFLGWLVSRYLAAYQLGYMGAVWDPFFGHSTVQVLTSKMSESLPVSDAGMGAFAYTFEALMAFMGGVARWRTMPWMVLFFGILVIPLGLVHIFLVGSQPVIVGQWCTLCLVAAAIMLVMIPLSVDEVVAMGQFVQKKVRDEGEPFWSVFWKGGAIGEMEKDERTPHYTEAVSKTGPAMWWGMSFPWTLCGSTLAGIALMLAPALLGTGGAMSNSLHIAGEAIVVISVIVMAEPLRAGRYLNALIGAWLVASPWFLDGATALSQWASALAGLLLVALSLPRGPITERYGGWERFIR
jgi:uncharacterized membrane protein